MAKFSCPIDRLPPLPIVTASQPLPPTITASQFASQSVSHLSFLSSLVFSLKSFFPVCQGPAVVLDGCRSGQECRLWMALFFLSSALLNQPFRWQKTGIPTSLNRQSIHMTFYLSQPCVLSLVSCDAVLAGPSASFVFDVHVKRTKKKKKNGHV